MGLWNLIFTLGVNRKPLQEGMQGAKRDVAGAGTEIKHMLGRVFATSAIIAWGKQITDTIGRIKDLSEQFGVTTDEVQKTDFALKQSGLEFENLTTALAGLARARREAVEGGEKGDELAAVFRRFGVEVEALNNPMLRNYDILLQMSEAMRGLNLNAKDQIELMDIFGPRVSKVLTSLQDLSSIKPVSLISEDEVKRWDKFEKSLSNITTHGKSITATLFGPLAEAVTGNLDAARKGEFLKLLSAPYENTKAVLKGVRNLIKGNEPDKTIEDALFGGLIEGAGEGTGEGGLFEVGKNAKKETEKLKAEKRESALHFSRQADSLLSIGNFLGTDAATSMRGQVQQITQRLTRIEQNTKRMADSAITIRK